MSSITLGGYWGPRATTPEELAAGIEEFLTSLATVADVTWRLAVDRPAGQSPAAPVEGPALVVHLNHSVHQDDAGGVMRQLGYSWSGWSEEGSGSCELRVTAGVTSRRVPNSVVLKDISGPFAVALGERSSATDLLATLVRQWRPERALIATPACYGPPLKRTTPYVGWLNYLTGQAALAAAGEPEAQRWEQGVLVASASSLAEVNLDELADLQARLVARGAVEAPRPLPRPVRP